MTNRRGAEGRKSINTSTGNSLRSLNRAICVSAGQHHWRVVFPIFAGGLLILASILKAIEFRSELSFSYDLVRWLFPVVIAQGLLGLLLVCSLWTRYIVPIAALTFTVFAGVAFAKAMRGDVDCGCFGPWSIHPAITCGVDILVVAGLTLSYRHIPSFSRGRFAVLVTTAPLLFATMSATTFWQPSARLNDDGRITGNGMIVLRPSTWVDRRSPVLDHQTVPQLGAGPWTVVLYQPNCRKCEILLDRLQHMQDGQQLAAISLHEAGHVPDRYEHSSLDQRWQWRAQTPVVLELQDGIVIRVQEGA